MKQADIEIGNTYIFEKTGDRRRQHLIGKPFKVCEAVQRKMWSPQMIYYNEMDERAFASNLRPMKDEEPF